MKPARIERMPFLAADNGNTLPHGDAVDLTATVSIPPDASALALVGVLHWRASLLDDLLGLLVVGQSGEAERLARFAQPMVEELKNLAEAAMVRLVSSDESTKGGK